MAILSAMTRLNFPVFMLAAWFWGCAPSLDTYRVLGKEGRIDSSAAVVGRASIEVQAPREIVWSRLVKAKEWPVWNPEVKSMEAAGSLDSGDRFVWGPGFPKIKSEVVIAEPDRELAWIGTMLYFKAIHRWTLAEKGDVTVVSTEESLQGAGVAFLYGREKLERDLEKWLATLKSRAEMDFHAESSGNRMTSKGD